MNAILPIHFGTSTHEADVLSLAIGRLDLYLDVEGETLVRVLAMAGLRQSVCAIEDLSDLHLEADCTDQDIRHFLQEVRRTLQEVLEDLCLISFTSVQIASSTTDFDSPLKWAGARLQDIIATLDWSLV